MSDEGSAERVRDGGRLPARNRKRKVLRAGSTETTCARRVRGEGKHHEMAGAAASVAVGLSVVCEDDLLRRGGRSAGVTPSRSSEEANCISDKRIFLFQAHFRAF